ncbi:uncharacterized protein LOC143026001 [Oratosquilla oratoria]|uniref:uncharacterized protein LOC143026001 n=1 Tax=Oratosquilla oratoria TaxID=337810 RepID=UPI003F7619C0
MGKEGRSMGVSSHITLSMLWSKIWGAFRKVAVEPVMLLDGLAYSVMIVYVENLQMEKICTVKFGFSEDMCHNITAYEKENLMVQQEFSVFGMYNGIIMAFLPLFFILFMGAWSDKYGRKVPLVIAVLGHLGWALGYLLVSLVPELPVEFLLLAALMDSLGGGTPSFLTAANAYISDVTSEESRTSRVGLANSIWYMGGPIGTLIGTYIYKYGHYKALFTTSLLMHLVSLVYLMFLPESHGPFAKLKNPSALKRTLELRPSTLYVYGDQKSTNGSVRSNAPDNDNSSTTEATLQATANSLQQKDAGKRANISLRKMVCDFFNYHRIVDSFKTTFKKREGHLRCFILMLILCNLLRRLGRGAYMYSFTRSVLEWQATDYGLWVTYKNFIAAVGSLVAVPLLSKGLQVSDGVLAMLGALSSVADYLCYGLVSSSTVSLIWVAPVLALLVNSCVIAIRSTLSKFVMGDELGKIFAVLGALDGVMPMVSFSLYTLVYHATVHNFPGAQFFFGAGANVIMSVIIMFIINATKSKSYDVESAQLEKAKGPVKPKSFRFSSEFALEVAHTSNAHVYTPPHLLDLEQSLSNIIKQEALEEAMKSALSTTNTSMVSLATEDSTLGDSKSFSKSTTTSSFLETLPTVQSRESVSSQEEEDDVNSLHETLSTKVSDGSTVSWSGVDNPAYTDTEDHLTRSIPWKKCDTFEDIASMYMKHISKNFLNPVVVFDGYKSGPTTKDMTHNRRSKGVFGQKTNGIDCVNAPADADVMIAKKGIEHARETVTYVIGKDTDLLVLLCHYAERGMNDLYFKSSKEGGKCWHINSVAEALGESICSVLPVVHALCGCDTTSRLYGIGKGAALRKVREDNGFLKCLEAFCCQSGSKDAISSAGEKSLVYLYGGKGNDTLDGLRKTKFCNKVGKSSTTVEVHSLPPTTDAAKYHSFRVYCQIQEWMGNCVDPEKWGWCLRKGQLEPKTMDSPVAPDSLLKLVRCQCKGNCDTQRCSCKRNEFECSSACGECKGLCQNSNFDASTDDPSEYELLSCL